MSVREFTFYGTAYVRKKVAITTYSDNYEIAHEKAMKHLEEVDNIEDYVVDEVPEVEIEIDEVYEKLLHEI